jgi:cardiolipin synthase
MTVPNLITIIRIILTPVFIISLLGEQFLTALIIFLACGVSDGIDGMVARLFKQKSRLGTYLDPLADKILLVSAYVVLAVIGSLPSWLAVMVLARDFLILLGVLIIYLNRVDLRLRPSIISKVNTCFQFITVLAVLSQPYLAFRPLFYHFFFYATGLLTIISGLHYIYFWLGFMGESPNGRKNNKGPIADQSLGLGPKPEE